MIDFVFRDGDIHWETMRQLCAAVPFQRLRSYVEAAIDEYKMEQEYQTFIQSLRDYVMSKEPMLDHVHIVHDGYFVLWELKYISEREQWLI